MTEDAISNYYEHKPTGKPRSAVILLHGLGSNGRDLISLAPFWARHLPETVFISPDAPFHCDMAPVGYQWFSLRDWSPASMLRGIKIAAPLLNRFIDAQISKYQLEPKDVALAGFSQGTMMSLFTAPRYKDRLAGVLGYSGALVWDQNEPLEAVKPLPVHLIHGEADMVVPVAAYAQARQVLEKSGFPVSGYTTPWLAHSIDDKGIESGAKFLSSVLDRVSHKRASQPCQ